MTPPKKSQDQFRFQAAAEYVAGYFNVKSVVIADNEGLVISHAGREDLKAEILAAKGLEVMGLLDRQIEQMIPPGGDYVVIKTAQDWLTIVRVAHLFMIVVANRQTDDLLHIRIARALEMILAHLKSKYPTLIQMDKPKGKVSRKNMEAVYV